MNLNDIKMKLLDAVEEMPNFIWYAGWFIVGYIVGSW